MPHSTVGRRHPRAGSVTVTELMHRVPPPDTGEADTPVAPAEHREQLGSLATAGRIAGISIGVLVLCGAIGATPMLVADHGDGDHVQRTARPALSGMPALLPDKLAAQLLTTSARSTHSDPVMPVGSGTERKTDIQTSPHSTPSRTPITVRGHDDTTQAMTSDSPPPGSETAATAPADAQPADLVRQFYRLASENPDAAAQLLDPGLLGSSLAGFVRSWHSTRALQVEQITQTSNNTATAVVRMLQPDGSWLRATELFTTTDGTQPMIKDVELLSAQHG